MVLDKQIPYSQRFRASQRSIRASPRGPPSASTIVRFCQHAELTLAVNIVEQAKFNKGIAKIGGSKSCCFWCKRWFELLNLRFAALGNPYSIIVRASHGKKTDSWLLPEFSKAKNPTQPPATLTTVEQQFVARLNSDSQSANEAIVSGRRRTDSRRLSDSETMSSAAKEVGWNPRRWGPKNKAGLTRPWHMKYSFA